MDKKIKGSWLIHHTHKLQGVTSPFGYENTYMAGKAGILLSAISSNDELLVSKDRVNTLAQAANITRLELPALIDVLKDRNLIDMVGSDVAVLGVTTTSALQHTSDIFDLATPLAAENAVIDLAEKASIKPVNRKEVSEEIGDIYRLSDGQMNQLMDDVEKIGFVDVEKIGQDEKIYFNGNLFRREQADKVKKVLDALTPAEQRKLIELNEMLKTKACIAIDEVKLLLKGVEIDHLNLTISDRFSVR